MPPAAGHCLGGPGCGMYFFPTILSGKTCSDLHTHSHTHLRDEGYLLGQLSHLCSLRKPGCGLQQASSLVPHWALPRDGPGTLWALPMRPCSLATVQGLCFVLAALQNCRRLGPGRAQNMTSGSGRGLGTLQSPGCFPRAAWAEYQFSCPWSCS